MLGDFSISYNGVTLNEQSKRSKNLWILLRYLIVSHTREISNDELIELLWPDESSENPMTALKVLLHRLRNVLDELNYPMELIISTNGTYSWNNAAEFTIDAEEFEQYYKEALPVSVGLEKKVSLLTKALLLYKGDFLAKMSNEQWLVPLTEYYRSIYQKAVAEMVSTLYMLGRISTAVDVCESALLVNPFDEGLHYLYIKALIDSGQTRKAKAQYNYASDMVRKKFGAPPSDELVSLMETIIDVKGESTADIDAVEELLLEDPERKGAFLCDYVFFRYLYQLEIRELMRNKRDATLCLLTLSLNADADESAKIETFEKAMKHLSITIDTYLRKSDVYTQLNAMQYVLLLHNTNDNVTKVMQRLMKNFRRSAAKLNVSIDCKCKTLCETSDKENSK